MTNGSFTRRRLLRAGAAATGTTVVGSTAGCLDSLPLVGDDGGSRGEAATQFVPDDAEMVVFADISGIVGDSNIRSIANAMLEEVDSTADGYSGPETVEELLEAAEDESEFDLGELKTMTVFGELNADGGDTYAGLVVESGLSESDLTDLIDDAGADYDDDTHNGQTVYTIEELDQQPVDGGLGGNAWWLSIAASDGALGVLGDGQYAIGIQDVVEDVIDAASSDGGMDSDLQAHYGSTNTGYVRMASEVPTEVVSGGRLGNVEGADEIEYVSGSFYSSSSSLGIRTRMHTDDSDAAADLEDAVDDLVSTLGMTSGETVDDVVDDIEFSTNQGTVRATYEASVEDLQEYATDVVSSLYTAQMGSSYGSSGAPAANFAWDYDARGSDEDTTLTITLTSANEAIRAGEIYIRGNLGGYERINQTWAALGDLSPNHELYAGDAITLAYGESLDGRTVTSAFDLSVVWVSPDGSTSAELSRNHGPDA